MVANCFKGVKFAKDYQESSNEALHAFDSGDDTPRASVPAQGGENGKELEYVKDSAIIYCDEFHDELEVRIKDRETKASWKDASAM